MVMVSHYFSICGPGGLLSAAAFPNPSGMEEALSQASAVNLPGLKSGVLSGDSQSPKGAEGGQGGKTPSSGRRQTAATALKNLPLEGATQAPIIDSYVTVARDISGQPADPVLALVQNTFGAAFTRTTQALMATGSIDRQTMAQFAAWHERARDNLRLPPLSASAAAGFWMLVGYFGLEGVLQSVEKSCRWSPKAQKNVTPLLEAWHTIFNAMSPPMPAEPKERMRRLFRTTCDPDGMPGHVFQILGTALILKQGFHLRSMDEKVVVPGPCLVPRYTGNGRYRLIPTESLYLYEDAALVDPSTGKLISVEIKSSLSNPADIRNPEEATHLETRADSAKHNIAFLTEILAMKFLEVSGQRDSGRCIIVGKHGITSRAVKVLIGIHPTLRIEHYPLTEEPHCILYKRENLPGGAKILKMRVHAGKNRKLLEMFDPIDVGEELQL